ncbi:MAG: uracil-DNA glycosylase family protein [Nibricoccus sp.]
MESSSALEKHLRALRACRRCPRMVPPPVAGNPVNSGVMLVGQAPGDKEPKLGRPFAWTAGKTLFGWFNAALGWREEQARERIYFAAVCRCFPGKNPRGGDRVPAPDEIENCAHWMRREFALIEPKLVIPVGKLAIAQFLPDAPLAEVVGRRFAIERDGRSFDLIPLPHPSGASTWHRMEPGKTLLQKSLGLIAEHAAVRALSER